VIRPFTNDLLLFVNPDSSRGLLDLEGKKILEGPYEYITELENGISIIHDEKKAGLFFNKTRKFVKPFFDDIGAFNANGVAIFVSNGKQGLINRQGVVIAQAEYKAIVDNVSSMKLYKADASLMIAHVNSKGEITESENYKNVTSISINGSFNSAMQVVGFAQANYGWFQNDQAKYGMRDSLGKIRVHPIFNEIRVYDSLGLTLGTVVIQVARRPQNRYYLIDHIKKKIVLYSYMWIDMADFSARDTAAMAHAITESQLYTLVSRSGKKLTPKINYVGDFKEGTAPFCMGGQTVCVRGARKGFLIEKPMYVKKYFLSNTMGRFNLYALGGKWGFIDSHGNVTIQPAYEYAFNFHNKRSIVRSKGKYGVIDSSAIDFVVQPAYDSISRLDGSGGQMFRLEMKKQKWGFVNYKGEFITDMAYDGTRDFKNGCAAVSRAGKWTFVDSTGKEISDFIFDKVRDFNEGLAAVKVKGKWGYIDMNAAVHVDYQYSEAGDFSEGKTWVKKLGKCGFIDPSGEEVIPFIYSACRPFVNGMAVVRFSRYGVIDSKGTLVISAKYSKVSDFNRFGTVAVFVDGNTFILDSKGSRISNKNIEHIEKFNEAGIAAFRKDNHWGYIDHAGNVIIKEQFTQAGEFQNGIALVGGVGEKYFIGTDGLPLNEKTYTRAGDFKNGIAHVRTDQGEGFIDTSGNLLFSPIRARIVQDFGDSILLAGKNYSRNYTFLFPDGTSMSNKIYYTALPFFKGYAFVKKAKWGIINKAALPVIDERFDAIGKLKEDKMRVQVKRMYGAATLDGKLVTETDYERVKYCESGIVRLERGEFIGYLSTQNEWVYKPAK